MTTAGELLARTAGSPSGVPAWSMLQALGGRGTTAADLFVSVFGTGQAGMRLIAGLPSPAPAPTLTVGGGRGTSRSVRPRYLRDDELIWMGNIL